MSVTPGFLFPSSDIPAAVHSYAQRNVQYSQRAGSKYTQGNNVKIQIDTGTPSAFLDPNQSYFKFRITITNPNFAIDYANFTYAGAASFIKDLNLYANGTAIETINDYNVVFNHYQLIMGKAIKPYHLYISRPVDQVMSNNLNAIKLPMIDRTGYIMGANRSSVPQYTGFYGNNQFLGVTTTNIMQPFPFNKCMNPNCFPDSIPPYPMSMIPAWDNLNEARMQDYMLFLTNVKCVPIGCTSSIKPNTDGYYLNTTYFTATYLTTNINNTTYVANATTTSNTIYPFNVTTTQGVTGTAGDSAVVPGTIAFDVTLPLLSGIIGLLATKALPTFLMNDFYIDLKLESNQKVFQCSMDPVRIIRGTHRDFVTNCALPSLAEDTTTLASYCTDGSSFYNIVNPMNGLFNNSLPCIGGTRNGLWTAQPVPSSIKSQANLNNQGIADGGATQTSVAGCYNKMIAVSQEIAAPFGSSGGAASYTVGGSTYPTLAGGGTFPLPTAAAGNIANTGLVGIPLNGYLDYAANQYQTFTNVMRNPVTDSTGLYTAPPVYGGGVQTFNSQYILSPIGLSPGSLGFQSGTQGYGFSATPITFPAPLISYINGITPDLTPTTINSIEANAATLTKRISGMTSQFKGSTSQAWTQDARYFLGSPGCFYTPNGQVPQYVLPDKLPYDVYNATAKQSIVPITSEYANDVIPFNANPVTAFPASFTTKNLVTSATGTTSVAGQNLASVMPTEFTQSATGLYLNNSWGPSTFILNTLNGTANAKNSTEMNSVGLTTNVAAGTSWYSLNIGPSSNMTTKEYNMNFYLACPFGETSSGYQVNGVAAAASNAFYGQTTFADANGVRISLTPYTTPSRDGVASYAAIYLNYNPTPQITAANINAGDNYFTGTNNILDIMSILNVTGNTDQNGDPTGFPVGIDQANLANSLALYSINIGTLLIAPFYPSFNYDFGNVCIYGTFLSQSQPQTWQMLNYIKSVPTYEITDVIFFTQQILLPTEISGAIVAAAAQGDITMRTVSITTSNILLQKAGTQNVQLNINLGCCNTAFFLFRPDIVNQAPNNSNEQIQYDCLCGYNPFASVSSTGATNNGFGSTAPLVIQNMPLSGNDMSIQLQIGNDYRPKTAITSVKEIGSELLKSLHTLNITDFGMNMTTNVTYDIVNNTLQQVYDIYSDGGFLTTFIDQKYMQDQTKVYNPILMYGTNPATGNTGVAQTVWAKPTVTNNPTILATVTDYYTMANQSKPLGFYNTNQFIPPSSTFMLGFDLDTFYGMTGKAQSGTYLGNFNTTLNLKGLKLAEIMNVYLECIYYHELRLSFQLGGTVLPAK